MLVWFINYSTAVVSVLLMECDPFLVVFLTNYFPFITGLAFLEFVTDLFNG